MNTLRRRKSAFYAIFACAGFLALLPAIAHAAPVTDDLWDISQGAVVTGFSAMNEHGSSPDNMFGGSAPSVEANDRTLFADFFPGGFGGTPLPIGTIHFVEWQTSAPIQLGYFKVFAAADGVNSTNRSFNHFTLYGRSSLADPFSILASVDVSVPYPVLLDTNLVISMPVAPVISHFFRAEFRQATDVQFASGPRIIELDGFAVPEPGSAAILGAGMAGGWMFRRRRR